MKIAIGLISIIFGMLLGMYRIIYKASDVIRFDKRYQWGKKNKKL